MASLSRTAITVFGSGPAPLPLALVEVRPQPALGLFERNSAPLRIFLELVAADLRHSEIVAVAMAEVEARDRRGWKHREILGERDLPGITAEHVEQDWLQTVVGTGRVARCRPDAMILLADQLLVREMLLRIAPQPLPHFRVKHFGEAFGEAVGERLQQDVVIVVDGLLEPLEVRFEAMDADRKTADPVLAVGIDEVGEAHIGPAFALLHLLAKERQPCPVVAGQHEHIIALALAAP